MFLLKCASVEAHLKDCASEITIKSLPCPIAELPRLLEKELVEIQSYLQKAVAEGGGKAGKWSQYLPLELQVDYLLHNSFDIDGTIGFLEKVNFVK